jgi:hypothetical protein
MSIRQLKEPKILFLEEEIYKARSKPSNPEISEFVAKYHRKYYPESTFGSVALAEMTFKEPNVSYDNLEYLPKLDTKFDDVRAHVDVALGLKDQDHPLHKTSVLHAKIWSAYLDLLQCDTRKAKETIREIKIEDLLSSQDRGSHHTAMILMYYSTYGIFILTSLDLILHPRCHFNRIAQKGARNYQRMRQKRNGSYFLSMERELLLWLCHPSIPLEQARAILGSMQVISSKH